MENAYIDPRWVTFKQAKSKGWGVKKGARGTQIEYWFPYDFDKKKVLGWEEYKERCQKDDGSNHIRLISKYFTVFNAMDVEGIPALPKQKEATEISQDELVTKLSKSMNVPIINDGKDRVYYAVKEDKIHMPVTGAFHSPYGYNSNALHELAHSTGAAHRLNRDLSGAFGTISYAYEELVAEISSCFMSGHLQVQHNKSDLQNHKAYVGFWIDLIKNDTNVLIEAIKDAEHVADYMECQAGLVLEMDYQKNKEKSFEADKEVLTVRLKGIGEVSAIQAMDLKPGQIIIGDYGNRAKVLSVTSRSAKMLNCQLRSLQDGIIRERRIMGTTKVGIATGKNRNKENSNILGKRTKNFGVSLEV